MSAAGVQVTVAQVQVRVAGVQVRAAQVQVRAAGVQARAAGVQVRAAQVQVRAARVQAPGWVGSRAVATAHLCPVHTLHLGGRSENNASVQFSINTDKKCRDDDSDLKAPEWV